MSHRNHDDLRALATGAISVAFHFDTGSAAADVQVAAVEKPTRDIIAALDDLDKALRERDEAAEHARGTNADYLAEREMCLAAKAWFAQEFRLVIICKEGRFEVTPFVGAGAVDAAHRFYDDASAQWSESLIVLVERGAFGHARNAPVWLRGPEPAPK